MNELTCEEVRERAAELALDALPGDQRAAVLAHLDSCVSCRALVDDLSMAADRLLLALPESDVPPALTAQLHHDVPPAATAEAMPTRRRWAWLGAAAALIAIIVVGVTAIGLPSEDDHPGVGSFALVTPAGATIGDVAIENSDEPWIHVTVDDDIPRLGQCVLVMEDGTRHEIGAWPVDDKYKEWGAPLDQSPERVHRAELIDTTGATIATAMID